MKHFAVCSQECPVLYRYLQPIKDLCLQQSSRTVPDKSYNLYLTIMRNLFFFMKGSNLYKLVLYIIPAGLIRVWDPIPGVLVGCGSGVQNMVGSGSGLIIKDHLSVKISIILTFMLRKKVKVNFIK